MVPTSDLEYFCSEHLCAPSLRDMLADAVMFFKLHKTWRVYICPIPECLCWFVEDDSLILHLIYNHHNHWPFLQHNPTEEQWCADVLHNTVWKPIDVERVLDMLFTTSLCGKSVDGGLDADHLGTLEWPLSDDSNRSRLLIELQKGFKVLLNSQQRNLFPVLSPGCLRALIVVASENILRHMDTRTTMHFSFRSLLHCSLLSFHFMVKKSLSRFVKFVKEMCNYSDEASQSKESVGSKDGHGNWTKGEYLDGVSIPDGCDNFVLDDAKLKMYFIGEEGIGSWLIKSPIIPTIKQVSPGAPVILQLAKSKTKSFLKSLRTVHMQSDLKSVGVASCLQLWNMRHGPMSLLDTMPSELASDSEPDLATVSYVQSTSCKYAKQRRIVSDSHVCDGVLLLFLVDFCFLSFLHSSGIT
jgi:Protein of unknown function (DUF629)